MGHLSRTLHHAHSGSPSRTGRRLAALATAAIMAAGAGAADPGLAHEAYHGTEQGVVRTVDWVANEYNRIDDSINDPTLPTPLLHGLQKEAANSPDSPRERQLGNKLWHHVHDDERLQKISSGIEVSGTIMDREQTADGDLTFNLKLDPQYRGLISKYFHNPVPGTIHVEVVCAGPVKGWDPSRACVNFKNPIDTSAVKDGNHVAVSGAFVYDRIHDFEEIHPALSIQPSRA